MVTNLDSINETKTSGQEPSKIQRRALIGSAMGALLVSSRRLLAQDEQGPVNNPFILLLKGIYQAVPHLPNLGFATGVVNFSDTSYMKTKIYPVFGVPGGEDQGNAIGQFYGSFAHSPIPCVCMTCLAAGLR